MAGDWIKFRTELCRSPKVLRVAVTLKLPKATVLGALLILWSLADEQTTNGTLRGMTFDALDQEVGIAGFCRALSDPAVDWARESDKGVTLPRWGEHNGKTAKLRAENARRQSRLRSRGSHENVTHDARQTAHQEQEQHRAREDAENKGSSRPPRAGSPPAPPSPSIAAAGGSAEGLCSLLLHGIPGMKAATAAVIARMASSEAKVVWAIERTKAAMADKSARNPVGYCRSLVANEEPPPGWISEWNRRQLAKAGARQAVKDIEAMAQRATP